MLRGAMNEVSAEASTAYRSANENVSEAVRFHIRVPLLELARLATRMHWNGASIDAKIKLVPVDKAVELRALCSKRSYRFGC
jgi:hypothetical protein